MAKQPLLRLNFYTTSNTPWAAGDEARIYWDDVNSVIVVAKNGTVLTDPSYSVALGLSITYDAAGVATTNYSGRYLLVDGTDGDPIDLPVGSVPIFVPVPTAPATPAPPVIIKTPSTDIPIAPVITPISPSPTPTPTPIPNPKILVGNGIDTLGYPVLAPTNFIP
jgi:hypothetical protein